MLRKGDGGGLSTAAKGGSQDAVHVQRGPPSTLVERGSHKDSMAVVRWEQIVLAQDSLAASDFGQRHEDLALGHHDGLNLPAGNPLASRVFIGMPLHTGVTDAPQARRAHVVRVVAIRGRWGRRVAILARLPVDDGVLGHKNEVGLPRGMEFGRFLPTCVDTSCALGVEWAP